ncbi:calcium-transporting ATPase 1 [mine drainage metagenome]|uniref:Calcium-transporting ATPase 1 n=1 Tax=mine drainage metagenome TaxID=410659 RepID=A0A1J5R3G8_9ZZZZ
MRVIAVDASEPPAAPEGLSATEAASRLAEYGPNTVPQTDSHRIRSLMGKLMGPVPWMLEAAAVLELVVGKVTEAVIVLALLVFNGVLSSVQEGRAADALTLLQRRLAVQSRVRRDGAWQLIDASGLVPGDVVHIRLGDAVPADLHLADGRVGVDESVLTGESTQVERGPGDTVFAGSTIRRGEATATVTATGARTSFGHTAELVRTATTQSHLEQLVFRIVWALLAMDGALVVAIVGYAVATHLPAREILPFVLILVIASVPVALPATFTLATSLGAAAMAKGGALVTHLAAIEEAAAMDLLFTDKTGTITQNSLAVAVLHPYGSMSDDDLLRDAALASDEATQDPIDLAVLVAARERRVDLDVERLSFVPFDPSTKRSEAVVRLDGAELRVVKGAPQVIATLVAGAPQIGADVEAAAAGGSRVLAVAAGAETLELVGLIGLADPPRPDSADLVARLGALGIRAVMVTGDTAPTAVGIARLVGLGERVAPATSLRSAETDLDLFDVYAGVLPADKLHLVEQAQRAGHVVGMTGDGVNDAPALKRAEVGTAVESATDVAKAAASIVLTTAGLGAIIAAVEAGRRIYQRMLTYTINKVVKTFQVALFLGLGLLATGTFVTTPRLILLLLFANDFVTTSLATDHVGFSAVPDRWRVRSIVTVALSIAVPWLAFSFGTFLVGRDVLHLPLAQVQTLVFLMLVFTGQATIYLVRERHHLWSSMPSWWMLGGTVADVAVVIALATSGTLMDPISWADALGVLGAVVLATLALDLGKVWLQSRSGLSGPARQASRAT